MARFDTAVGGLTQSANNNFEVVMLAGPSGTFGGFNENGALSTVLPATNYDAFGRIRISDMTTIFDCQFQYDKQPLIWNEIITGSASSSHDAGNSSVKMTVTTANGDSVIRQTKEYFRYQPAKSQLIFATFDFGEAEANTHQYVGYFDKDNGLYLKYANNNISFVLRSNATGVLTETEASQSEWIHDKLDGTGNSGITLVPTNSQILFADFEWLGKGTVRAGFVIDSKLIYTHSFYFANRERGVYMTTANLPIRYEIKNVGPVSAGTSLLSTCCSVNSEGGVDETRGIPFSVNNDNIKIAFNATETPIISISPNLTYNGVETKYVKFVLQDVDLYSDATCLVRIRYNPTLTGALWEAVDPNSAMNFDETATAVSGGTVLKSFYVPSTTQSKQSLRGDLDFIIPISLNYYGNTSDIITVTAQTYTGSSTASGSINWKEIK